MTSVDSGVETGNDSNDSLVAQHENNAATSSANSGIVVNNGGQAIVDVGPSKSLVLPIAAICPGPDNTMDSQGPSAASTSGPLVLHSSAERRKVLEFRLPQMYSASRQYNNMRELQALSNSALLWCPQYAGTTYQRKMKTLHEVRRTRNHVFWREFQGPMDERKMRLAAATNNVEMMRRLLSSGVSPNNHDEQGRSPLHLAACRGYTDVVRLLLEHGADPNQRDCIGNTALHLAAVTSKISVVTLLLKAGTDILSSDRHGYSPLQLAQTKLKMLQNCKGPDMNRIKEEVHNVVGMLLAYLQKQKDACEQVEALSTICSRLSLSSTSDQVQGDVRDLLANISGLSLTS